jgi:hypothetical protein
MKLKLILATAIVGAALALPSVSSAAPPPAPTFQDSVSLTEAPAVFGILTVYELTATSGPNGENPSGEVGWAQDEMFGDVGPVTCLAVSGNSATLNYVSVRFARQIITIHVVDDSPTLPPGSNDTFSLQFLGRAATDCAPPTEMFVLGQGSGDITVVDAQPPPTTRGQCLNNGWKQFGFANQGLCLAFVSRS